MAYLKSMEATQKLFDKALEFSATEQALRNISQVIQEKTDKQRQIFSIWQRFKIGWSYQPRMAWAGVFSLVIVAFLVLPLLRQRLSLVAESTSIDAALSHIEQGVYLGEYTEPLSDIDVEINHVQDILEELEGGDIV
jgi:hypothetical protein